MVNKLKYLILLTFLLIPTFNVSALPLDSVRIYYYNDAGQLLNNGTTINDNWGGSQAFFNNIGFTVGSFQDIPSSVYAFFPSGQGCDNTTCLLQGEIISNESTINTTSYTPLDDVEINVEANGHYTRCSVIGRYRQYDRFTHVTFQCSASNLNNGFNINYSNMGVTAGRYTYFGVVPAAFTITSNLSTQDIIISNNANTNNIINNQNSNTNQIIEDNQQNTQDVIDNQNQNTQDVIDNQNQNTQDIINSQNETFGNYCYDNLFDKDNANILNAAVNGSTIQLSGSAKSIYIPITGGETYTISKLQSARFRAETTIQLPVSGVSISDYQENDNGTSLTIRTNLSANYLLVYYYLSGTDTLTEQEILDSIMITEGTETLPYTPYGEKKCINKLDEQTNAINDLNDSITSEESPNTNQDLNDMNNMVSSDTPISDLITLPLTLINAYINGISSSCSPVNLGNLYGTDLILPCINLEERLGSNLWSIIDTFFCIFMCYNIGMLFITAFDGITSLRDDFEGLYQPRHADTGYQPKHGGGN